jgi:hypothetical protein
MYRVYPGYSENTIIVVTVVVNPNLIQDAQDHFHLVLYK